MSRIPSVADHLEIWKEMVKAAPPTPTPPTPKKITHGNLSPSPEVGLILNTTPQVTLSQFLMQYCPDECGILANKILKKLLPALRQHPSSYPLCSVENASLLDPCSPQHVAGHTVELDSNRAGMPSCIASHPKTPSAPLNTSEILLHPSIPDFILEGIAHFVLHTFAIPTYREEKIDQNTPVTKELCESLIRSLTVSSIYLAGKVPFPSFFLIPVD